MKISEKQTTLLMADCHFPYQDDKAINQTIDYGKSIRPDTIILNGDIIDLYSVSHFEKDPKKRNLKQEIDTTKEFLKELRRSFRFSRIIYKLGNHEKRLKAYLWKHAEDLSDLDELTLESLLNLDNLGIETVDHDEIIELGDLNVIHGQEVKGVCSSYPAKSLYGATKTNALAGHAHRESYYMCRTIRGEIIKCFTVGCLCELKADFMPYNDWSTGFAVIETDDKGKFEVALKSL